MEHSSTKQLKFYPSETSFNIKCKNFQDGKIRILKDISLDDYLKSLKYLKYLNLSGYNVFFSPSIAAGGVVDVLLDDLPKATIEQLSKDGFEPLYLLETSQSNYQAIIRLSSSPLDKSIHGFISRQLSELYHADINSSDIGHFFRLSGFTNRKQKYRSENNNLYPFVKLYFGKSGISSNGQEYIERIRQGIRSGLIELPLDKDKDIGTPPALQAARKNGNMGCFAYVEKVYQSGSIDDISSLDFKAAMYASRKGFSIEAIKDAMLKLSPNIEQRKKGHIDDYLLRTIKNASLRL